MTQFISPRDLQRSSKKILEQVNKTRKPAIILSKKKPVGVIITYKSYAKMKQENKLDKLVKQALKESREGKTRIIRNEKDFEAYEKEVLELAK